MNGLTILLPLAYISNTVFSYTSYESCIFLTCSLVKPIKNIFEKKKDIFATKCSVLGGFQGSDYDVIIG